ncbi:hypothetical protein T4B_14202 [Trichinella pseudospiralis]|uniref:Uncharacterized protein n=2 Tax=Trichinella pseudospiralis TaxID=6337 RepID=A0A0V1JH78_TRIPS|nr:hypothetical protein T4D_1280 [Trichinella pseudospiralis]KRZ34345.1 hypothetical protein T4B_14202 [Trichinella pseudospiralis]
MECVFSEIFWVVCNSGIWSSITTAASVLMSKCLYHLRIEFCEGEKALERDCGREYFDVRIIRIVQIYQFQSVAVQAAGQQR